VALLYAHRYPDSLKRSVLMAANPPGRMIWEASQLDNILSRLNAYCQQNGECRERTDDLIATIRSVLGKPPESWLGFGIDSDRVRAAAFLLLYSKKTMPYLVDIYVAAEQGDASGLLLLSKSMDFLGMSGMLWGDLLIKGISADFDGARDYHTDFDPPGTVFGAPMSELIWPLFSGEQRAVIPESYCEPQTSDVETLIISGDLDVSTPAENATLEIMPYLPNGHQVILRQAGHMDLNTPETIQMYLKFLDTGEVDTSQLVERPIQFATRFSVGTMIRGGLLGLLLLLSALLGLLWLGYRRFRRRTMVTCAPP
jgi:pimeloyl-ACP methyl ester carboxylesterase